MRRAQRQQVDEPVELDLGGLLREMGSLFDLVAEMTDKGSEEAGGTGAVSALGGRVKGVFGFSVRMGLSGKPVIERFGNIQETAAGPVVAEIREPLVDLLQEEDHLAIIAELPGVEERDLHIRVDGDVVHITAKARGTSYQGDVRLPFPAGGRQVKSTYRNGVLEIRLAHGQPSVASPRGG